MAAPAPQDECGLDERISSLVSEFFDRRQAGEDLAPECFAADHPDVEDELRACLEGLALIETACGPTGTGPAAGGGPCGELPQVEGYELREEIGRGGMGVVYKALQRSTNRVVAVKVMLGDAFLSSATRRRFEREVQLAARLQHPNIVRVFEGGRLTGQDRPYYALELVEGVQMDTFLATRKPDLRTTLYLLERVSRAVDYAHRQGVIHRDLKPANVLIDAEGQPHILDFGLAKAIGQTETQTALTTCYPFPGAVVGTLYYLSPEQADGLPELIDARTDVYALGVMLYEAVTGSLPFDTRGRPAEVIQRMLDNPPIAPSAVSDRVDRELETIILKALEKEREQRYATAQELADDIRRYLDDEPILARRPSSIYVLRKRVLKHRWAVSAAAALVLAGATLLTVGLQTRFRALARAQADALECLHIVEGASGSRVLSRAQALYARHPEVPAVRLVWARALYANEQQEDAVRLLEQVLVEDPSRWLCRALLIDFHRAMGNRERVAGLAGPPGGHPPDSCEAWYLRSFATLDRTAALRCAERAVEREPEHAFAWRRLAHLRLQTGDLEGALAAAERVAAASGSEAGWAEGMHFKAQVLARQGRWEEVIRLYTAVIQRTHPHADAYLYRAHAYRRTGAYEQAVADYTRRLELEGETTATVWHYYQRATPLWILGRTSEALADYRRVRAMLGRPFYSDARRYLILRQVGRADQARAELGAALGEVQDHWVRQILRCLTGEISPEALVAEGVTRRKPEQICEAFYYAGEAAFLLGRRDQARACFAHCVETRVEFDPDTALGTPMNEYELALWRLRTLFGDSSPTMDPAGFGPRP